MLKDWTPQSKVTDGFIGGALATVGLGTAQVIWPMLQFPPGYEAGIAVLLTAVVSYMFPERRQ
jgi:hypothetical protein